MDIEAGRTGKLQQLEELFDEYALDNGRHIDKNAFVAICNILSLTAPTEDLPATFKDDVLEHFDQGQQCAVCDLKTSMVHVFCCWLRGREGAKRGRM